LEKDFSQFLKDLLNSHLFNSEEKIKVIETLSKSLNDKFFIDKSAVCIFEKIGKIVFWNKLFEDYFSDSVEEIQKHSIFEISQLKGIRINEIIKNLKDKFSDIRILNTKKGEKSFQINIDKLSDAKSEVYLLQIVDMDENKLRLAEEFNKLDIFYSLSENISEFFWISKKINGIEHVEYFGGIEKITGYTADEIKSFPGRVLYITIEEDKNNIALELSKFEQDSTLSEITLIYRIKRKDENIAWIKERIKVKRNEKGEIESYYGVVLDITDFKETEKKLKEKEEALKQTNSAKDRFISIVAHDLRAPFTSILGFAEILLNEPDIDPEEKEEYLTYIYEASQNQLQLINYLLDWSRLQSGAIKVEPKRISAKKIVDDCVAMLTGNAIRKNIELKALVSDDIYVHADERLLTQAIQNLLSNAIKFTPDGLSVTISVQKFKSGMVEFIVKDQGVGIPEKDQEKIFRFDVKYTTEGTRGEKGSGLGLTLVKEIIEKHGGQIWFYSEQNVGTEFHFTIPEANLSIAIIEDNKADRLLFIKVIEKNFPSAETFCFQNGFEALAELKKIPDIIIADHDMPLINGLQFIEGFKEKFQDSASKILIISSHLDDDLIEKYKSYGVVEILIKPVDIKKLTESLNKLAF